MPRLQRTTAFGVYRGLATSEAWPPAAARAWADLAARARGRDALRMDDAAALQDPLAREVLRFVLRRRAEAGLVADAASRGEPVRQADGLDARAVDARAANEEIPARDVDRRWFAAQVAELLLAEARRARVEEAARAAAKAPPGVDAYEGVREARFRFLAPERDRLVATTWRAQADARAKPQLVDAALGFAFGSDALWGGAPHAAQAAKRLSHLGLEAIYAHLDARGDVDGPPPPTAAQKLVDDMKRAGAIALQRAAAEDWARENTKLLPVLYGTAERMRSLGIMSDLTFDGVELWVRTHVLPSLGSLVDVLRDHGGLRDVVVSGKGVSSAPLTVAALERTAKAVDPGWGESKRSAAEHHRALRAQVDERIVEARAAGRPVLVLGDGRDSALAVRDAAIANPDVRVAYVEFTQSGLTALQEAGPSPLHVVSFADTPLKKLCESRILGEWLVAEELKLSAAQGLPAPAKGTAVVLGHGSVGSGVTNALLARGFEDVVVVEPDAARAAQVADGATVVDRADEALSRARWVFSCVGRDGVVDRAALSRLPDGCVVVNCASKGEVDTDALAALEKSRDPAARAVELEPENLPEHRTLVVELDGKKVFVRKRGQPLFDGVRDKDPVLADVYMAGLFCALCVAADALKSPAFRPGTTSIPARMQEVVLGLVEECYEERFPDAAAGVRARAAQEPAPKDDVDYLALYRSLSADAREQIDEEAKLWKMRDEARRRIGRLATSRPTDAPSSTLHVPFDYVVLVLKELLAQAQP